MTIDDKVNDFEAIHQTHNCKMGKSCGLLEVMHKMDNIDIFMLLQIIDWYIYYSKLDMMTF